MLPPSITISVPVIYLELSEARNMARSPISSIVPSLPFGLLDVLFWKPNL
jgi:hypothetical protein